MKTIYLFIFFALISIESYSTNSETFLFDSEISIKTGNVLKNQLDNTLSLRGSDSVETNEIAARYTAYIYHEYMFLMISHVYFYEYGGNKPLYNVTKSKLKEIDKSRIKKALHVKNFISPLIIDNAKIISLLDKYIDLTRKGVSHTKQVNVLEMLIKQIDEKILYEWGPEFEAYMVLGEDVAQLRLLDLDRIIDKKVTLKEVREYYNNFIKLKRDNFIYSPPRVYRKVKTVNQILKKNGYIQESKKDLLRSSVTGLYNYIYFNK